MYSCRVTGRENLFEVVTPSRTFFVQVDTKEDMKDWVAIFQQLLHTVKPISSPPAIVSCNCVTCEREGEREREGGREGEGETFPRLALTTGNLKQL